jgi:hypothetical protein
MITFKQFLGEMGFKRHVVHNALQAFERIVEDLIWEQLKKQKIHREDVTIIIWNGQKPHDRYLRIHIHVGAKKIGKTVYDPETLALFFPKLFIKLLAPYFKGLRVNTDLTGVVTNGDMIAGDPGTEKDPFRVDLEFRFDHIDLSSIDPEDRK